MGWPVRWVVGAASVWSPAPRCSSEGARGLSLAQQSVFQFGSDPPVAVSLCEFLPRSVGDRLVGEGEVFTEFLVYEEWSRARWLTWLAQLNWFHYSRAAFGAPEYAPIADRPVPVFEDGSALPLNMLDNLDTLAMLGWTSELQRCIAWLELGTLLFEAPRYADSPYLVYRAAYINATDHACDIIRVRACANAFLGGDDASLGALATAAELCLPPIERHRSFTFASKPVDLYNMLRTLRHTFRHVLSLREGRVSFFEMTIRALGGLLGGWNLYPHPILSYSAWELGHRLSFGLSRGDLFSTASIPPRFVWLEAWQDLQAAVEFHEERRTRTMAVPSARDTSLQDMLINMPSMEAVFLPFHSSAAVAMTNQMEFIALAQLTEKARYFDDSMDAMMAYLHITRWRPTSLLTKTISVRHGHYTDSLGPEANVGSETDSAYEYLVKVLHLYPPITQYLLHIVTTLLRNVMLHAGPAASPRTLTRAAIPFQYHYTDTAFLNVSSLYGLTAPHTKDVFEIPDQLQCFIGGLLDRFEKLGFVLPPELVSQASRLKAEFVDTCTFIPLLTVTGLAPEDARTDLTANMRPEHIESLYYDIAGASQPLHKAKRQNLLWVLVDAFFSNGLTPRGLCSVPSVDALAPTLTSCRQESWVLAETLKYALLSFSHPFLIPASHSFLSDTVRATAAVTASYRPSQAHPKHLSDTAVCHRFEDFVRKVRDARTAFPAPGSAQRVTHFTTNSSAPQVSPSPPLKPTLQQLALIRASHQAHHRHLEFTTEAHPLWKLRSVPHSFMQTPESASAHS